MVAVIAYGTPAAHIRQLLTDLLIMIPGDRAVPPTFSTTLRQPGRISACCGDPAQTVTLAH